jgi:aminoglycoside phosphotransferase family enzyme
MLYMAQHPIDADLKVAFAAVRHARDVRKYHARRTKKGSVQREIDLEEALQRLRESMKPLRSYLGQVPYKEESHTLQNVTENVYKASAAIQSERRKLWKMQNRKTLAN